MNVPPELTQQIPDSVLRGWLASFPPAEFVTENDHAQLGYIVDKSFASGLKSVDSAASTPKTMDAKQWRKLSLLLPKPPFVMWDEEQLCWTSLGLFKYTATLNGFFTAYEMAVNKVISDYCVGTAEHDLAQIATNAERLLQFTRAKDVLSFVPESQCWLVGAKRDKGQAKTITNSGIVCTYQCQQASSGAPPVAKSTRRLSSSNRSRKRKTKTKRKTQPSLAVEKHSSAIEKDETPNVNDIQLKSCLTAVNDSVSDAKDKIGSCINETNQVFYVRESSLIESLCEALEAVMTLSMVVVSTYT